MMTRAKPIARTGALVVVLSVGWPPPAVLTGQGGEAGGTPPAGGPAASQPRSNVDYWLSRAATAPADAGSQPAAVNPFAGGASSRPALSPSRPDALPGVALLSDGTVLAGGTYTTLEKDWEVWVEAEQRFRHVPPILVLGIQAVVVEEGMDKEWRWKEMGSDEKVFTGRERPIRRFLWRLHLIDGSYVAGAIKGQPVWIESAGGKHGPFVLQERSAGPYGQTLKDLVYLKHLVISRRAMEQALKRQATTPGDTP